MSSDSVLSTLLKVAKNSAVETVEKSMMEIECTLRILKTRHAKDGDLRDSIIALTSEYHVARSRALKYVRDMKELAHSAVHNYVAGFEEALNGRSLKIAKRMMADLSAHLEQVIQSFDDVLKAFAAVENCIKCPGLASGTAHEAISVQEESIQVVLASGAPDAAAPPADVDVPAPFGALGGAADLAGAGECPASEGASATPSADGGASDGALGSAAAPADAEECAEGAGPASGAADAVHLAEGDSGGAVALAGAEECSKGADLRAAEAERSAESATFLCASGGAADLAATAEERVQGTGPAPAAKRRIRGRHPASDDGASGGFGGAVGAWWKDLKAQVFRPEGSRVAEGTPPRIATPRRDSPMEECATSLAKTMQIVNSFTSEHKKEVQSILSDLKFLVGNDGIEELRRLLDGWAGDGVSQSAMVDTLAHFKVLECHCMAFEDKEDEQVQRAAQVSRLF